MANILVSTENLPYADWLEWRKKGIGGSDASVVCGINRYKSPVELWMEKTDQLQPQEAGESAYWGTILEAVVREEFTKRTGLEVRLVKQLLQSEEHPFMLANLDGVCNHPDYGTCIFEAKTATAYKAGFHPRRVLPSDSALHGRDGLSGGLYRRSHWGQHLQVEVRGAG